MGYYKNQLIAQQVEVGDRVPSPKPASQHVAHAAHTPIKGLRLPVTLMRSEYLFHLGLMAVTGLAIGFLLGGVL